MPDTSYPVFEGGQTLTAADLNELRGFLHQRDRLLGRLIGFGVSCGLTGTVSGSTLTIAPGLAVDQTGEPLLMPAARTIPLPPTSSGVPFDVVAAGAGGFSVVLEMTDTVVPAPECGEESCEGHAEEHVRDVALRVVPGRVTGPRFDFAADPLLAVEPMRLSLTSQPQGSYVTLRNALVTRLTNGGQPLIGPALIGALQSTSISSTDLPGVRGYKAGFLNQVLFATLDLLRCRALMTVTCHRPAARPGVVLGHLAQGAGGWTWDCRYRHAWEPPVGLSQALVGGACGDPCDLYRDEVEGLIAGYAPPDPPPTQEPEPGPGWVVPDDIVFCPRGSVFAGGRCVNIVEPPERIPDWWRTPWVDPLGPIWNPSDFRGPRVTPPHEVYGGLGWDYFDTGVLNGLPVVGASVTEARAVLEEVITGLDGTPNVLAVGTGEVANLRGFENATSFSPADTIVLATDGHGRVVATGRVPAGFTARKIGTELPQATAAASEALAATSQHGQQLAGVGQEVAGLQGQVERLASFEHATLQWRGQVDQTLGGMSEVIVKGVDQVVGARFDDVQRRLSTMEGSVDVLGKLRSGSTEGRAQAFGQRLDQDVAHGIVEFAETVNDGLKALVDEKNERTLGRYVGESTRAAAKLEVIAAAGDPISIGDATVALLGTLRTAVKAAGVDPSVGKQLDVQLTTVKGLLG